MTTEDLSHTNQIYGPNVNGIKVNTSKHNIPEFRVKMATVLPSILSLYCNLTCSTNIMFANKLPFLAEISLIIRYHYIARIMKLQVTTILKVSIILHNLYAMRSFILQLMNMEPKLYTLRPNLKNMHIHINNIGQVDHIPKTERLICTTKGSAIYALSGTPFKKFSTMIMIGIILETFTLVNAIDAKYGVFRNMIPNTIDTVRQIIYHKHCGLTFCNYYQTHEEGDNTITKNGFLREFLSSPLVIPKVFISLRT